MEAQPHLLDDEITPRERLFVRNNGRIPDLAYGNGLSEWRLVIDGEVKRPLKMSYDMLKKNFKKYSYHLVLECGGNGRAGFFPKTKGNQWTYGAVGCPTWQGVLLKDVLAAAEVNSSVPSLSPTMVTIFTFQATCKNQQSPEVLILKRP